MCVSCGGECGCAGVVAQEVVTDMGKTQCLLNAPRPTPAVGGHFLNSAMAGLGGGTGASASACIFSFHNCSKRWWYCIARSGSVTSSL
eukprot:2158267-Amphidinium_carterae.1